jgi:hypothetical protein
MPCEPSEPQQHNPIRLHCTITGCPRWFQSAAGHTRHVRYHHHFQTASQPLGSSPSPLSNMPSPPPNEEYVQINDRFDVPTSEGPCSLRQSSPPVQSPRSTLTPDQRLSPQPPGIRDDHTAPGSRHYHPLLDGEIFSHFLLINHVNILYRKAL